MRYDQIPQFADMRLYKYRPWNEYSEKVLKDCEIYFSNPREVNDPFDCRFPNLPAPQDDQLRKYLEIQYTNVRRRSRFSNGILLFEAYIEASLEQGASDPPWESIVDAARRIILDKSCFCSFSEVNNNVLMYSHYAASHTGICFEFRFTFDYALSHVEAVRYSSAPAKVDVFDYECDEEELVVATMYEKHESWAYEREWRAFNLRQPRGTVRWDPRCLSGIILGCKMPESDRQRVAAVLQESPADPILYEAVMSSDGFNLEIRKLGMSSGATR